MDIVRTENKTGLYWLWLAIVIIVLDQVMKYWITTLLEYHESIYILPFLNFTLAHNTGAAFSFLSKVGDFALWLFIATAVIISSVLCVWMHRLPPKNHWLGSSLALILGGAIGNLLDRIFYGYVLDYIHFHLGNWSFPIFNLADTAITVGALMLIIDILKKK